MHCITNADIQQMAENEEGWNGTCHSQLLREDSCCSLSRSSPTHSCLTAVPARPTAFPSRLGEMSAPLPPNCRSLAALASGLAPSTSVVVGHIIHLGLGAVAATTSAASESRGRERAPPGARCSASSGRAQPPRDVIRDARGREAALVLSLLPSVAASATRATPPASRHLE